MNAVSAGHNALSTVGVLLTEVAHKYHVALQDVVCSDEHRLLIQLLKPSLGTLCIRSENTHVLSVYHHPPAISMGYAVAIWNAEDFVLREMDLLLSDNGIWCPIRYSCGGLSTKNPAELRFYYEAWGEVLHSQDWLGADLVALESKILEPVHEAVHHESAESHNPHRGLFGLKIRSFV